MRLDGYTLASEDGRRYRFPDVSLPPGYTVIVASTPGPDGLDARGQLVVHWPQQAGVWDPQEDTAILTDAAGRVVDTFHYKGKRVSRSPRRSTRGSP